MCGQLTKQKLKEEKLMNSRKNRFISGFLSFVMVFTLVLQVLPPIEVSAATPEAVTDEVSNVTDSSITLNGYLSKNGGYTIKEYGFAYGINNGSTKYKTFYGALEKEKNVSFVLKNLSPGDAGWYQFYVVNSNNEEHKGEYEYWEIEDEDSNPPMIDPIKSSAGTSFAYGKSTTFSTKVSDETELDEIIMYIDGDEVKSVSASGTSGSISYTTSKLDPGEHEILVEAYDAAGNDNSTDITVEVLLERPEITSPDTHTWPSDKDLTIKWDAVSGASYYLVTVTDNDVNNNTEYIYDEKKVSGSSRKITVYSDDLYGEHYLKVYIVAYSSDGIESLIGSTTFYIEPTAIIVDPDIIGFSAAGGTYDIDVYSDSNWKIENLSSFKNWITASPSSGFGDKTITLTIKKNTTAYERGAALKFTDDYETVYLRVTQAGVEQYLDVSDETLTVDYRSGNSGRIDIESNIEWSLAENTDWFSLSCKTGEGDGSFYFIVDENSTSESRTGSAWIHNSVGIVEVKLTQEGNPNISLDPQVNSITSSMNPVSVGKEFSITITTNSSTAGIQLFVKENGDKHNLGSTTAVNSQTSTTKSFVLKYTFNSTGLIEDGIYVTNTRRIYAYPIDANGNVIEDDSVGSYYDITVTPADYTLGDFTAYDTEVELGENATIGWSAASAETNDTVYYNVYIGTKTSNILLTPNKTSARSITVDSSLLKEIGAGTYAVMVIATAANHGQKQVTANITITASSVSTDITKPVINPISSSADPIIYGTSVTFSTAASDETALDKVEMYMDGSLVRTVSAADTYANISYTTSSISEGTHTVLVKAYDDAGNYNSWSQSFTVKKISSGIVHSVELSDYDFYAGSYITFTVKTSKDTTKIRLVDGSYAFSVQSSGYKDSGNYRIWTFEQYVGTVGTNRKLKVESYSGGWTGNYSETAPFTVRKNIVDVGDFEIISPASGTKHQFNASLTVTWTEPYIEPDWYVVNVSGVPSGSDLISINGNSAVISGSVFDEYGTYSISVTAQKSGYNQSETYTNVVVGCLHEDRTLVGVKYGSAVYYNTNKHSVTVIPRYSCNTCGGTFTRNEDATTEYSSHNHDVELDNNGWLCDCGYVETGTFSTWKGYLQSYENEKAYSRVLPDGSLTNWDGISKIYPQDDITVLGTKYNSWLVRYNVGSNGTKVRFVARELIDTQPYTGIDIQYITVNGSVIKCIYSSQQRTITPIYYADFYSLMQALNAQPVYVQNNHYYCQATPRDYVNGRYIYMSVDLSNYKVNNWQNVYAYTTDYNKDVIPGFCVGSYVYSGNIFIELEELMNLLSYTRLPDGSYVQPNDPRDYSAISIASRILGKSQEFDLTYDSLVNKYVGTALSDIYYGVTLQWNELEKKKINSDPDIEIIASIKESLVQAMGSLPAAQQKEADEFLKFMTDTLPDVFEYGDKATIELMFTTNFKNLTDFENHILLSQILGELGEVFKGVGLAFDIHEFWISCENLGSVTATEIYIMYCLAQNYDYNKAILANLINNAATDEMKAVYRKVDRELELYYNNLMLGILQTGATNPEIREKAVDTIAAALNVAGFSSGAVFGKINIYAAVYAAVSSYVDAALGGTKVYNAQDKIYTFKESLDILTPDLEKAITTYQNSPTTENKQNMINYAIIVGNLRCKSIDACIEFIYSQYIRNAFDYYFNDSNALWNRHSSLLDEQESIQRYMTQLGGK